MKLFNYLRQPLKSKLFYFFLLANLISNGACLFFYHNPKQVCFAVALSFFYAYIETTIYNLLFFRWLKSLYVIILCLLLNVFIITDFFLIFVFHKIFNEDVADIIIETNPTETANFFESYLSIPVFLAILFGFVAFNYLILYISKLLSNSYKSALGILSLLFVLIGFSVFVYMGFSYVFYRNGMNIPQYASITRFSHTINVVRHRVLTIHQLQAVCDSTVATCNDPNRPTVVVIIGESHSSYHSSLYGYPLDTNPLLKKRLDEGNFYLFDNVVSVDDHTHGAMKSVFSLDSLGVNFNNRPLFPKCFKAAGYYTAMYDNQYMVGSGISFLTDKGLSESLFDERNDSRYSFDGDLVDAIEVKDVPSLYVIHLWGQHYTYMHRYPAEYEIFTSRDYDEKKYNISQRTVIAHYDNACLYNDFVINKIISKFENMNAVVFYLSDHGEEIYELRDYMGHGDAVYSPDLRLQIRVPLFVYVSESFRNTHMDLCHQFKESEHKPITTDDISHVILNAASIQTPFFSAERCFTNPTYEEQKPRIVLYNIDYNQLHF